MQTTEKVERKNIKVLTHIGKQVGLAASVVWFVTSPSKMGI